MTQSFIDGGIGRSVCGDSRDAAEQLLQRVQLSVIIILIMTEIGEKLTEGMQGCFKTEYKIRYKPSRFFLFFFFTFLCVFNLFVIKTAAPWNPRKQCMGHINKNNIK